MRIYNPIKVAALSLIVVCAACSNTSTSASAMTDEQLENAIETQISADAQLMAYNIDVDADAANNRVTLSGNVPTQELRALAMDKAKEVNPDLTIADEIDVKPGDIARSDYTEGMATEARGRAQQLGDSIGASLDDAWIHTKIRTRLAGQGELPFGGVNVDVVDNVVTLRGTVGSQEDKTTAELAAKETDGVTQVKNQLTIKKG